jgi:hypothetical protein
VNVAWSCATTPPRSSSNAGAHAPLDCVASLAIYETRLRSRMRLVEIVRHALPVVSSAGCEIAEILRREGAGFVFPTGDGDGLARVLVHLAGERSILKEAASRGRLLSDGLLSFATITLPLREWVKAPRCVPDRTWRVSWTLKNRLRRWAHRTIWTGLGRL